MKRFQNFREEFERIHEITDRASRGKMLEKFLGDFLKCNGFDVKFNPKGTKPRQSDLFACFYEGQKRIKTSHKLEKDSKFFFKQEEFLISSASESSGMIECLFARTIPDTNWGNYGDHSALLQLDLDINNIDDLEEVLCLIDELFGLSNEGSYSIKQWNISWFGFGASNFLFEAKNWSRRYHEKPPKQIHHSEGLSYFDSFLE